MERPILFSAPMVQAILEGRKTQTRRIIKPQPRTYHDYSLIWKDEVFAQNTAIHTKTTKDSYYEVFDRIKTPYGKIGDLLWVQEAFIDEEDYPCSPYHEGEIPRWTFKADVPSEHWKQIIWKPSIHMPRWASRITLEITNIRVERIQDISYDDAIAEGFTANVLYEPITLFHFAWADINGDKSWNDNPFVWVISFKKV